MSFRPSRQFAASVRIDETPERRGVFSGRRPAAAAPAPAPEPGTGEAADLYYRRPPRALAYRHFDSADAAIQFAHDNLSAPEIASCVLQVGERRFEGGDVAAMVKRLGGPVRRKAGKARVDA
jgi:hypothetical protein